MSPFGIHLAKYYETFTFFQLQVFTISRRERGNAAYLEGPSRDQILVCCEEVTDLAVFERLLHDGTYTAKLRQIEGRSRILLFSHATTEWKDQRVLVVSLDDRLCEAKVFAGLKAAKQIHVVKKLKGSLGCAVNSSLAKNFLIC